MHCALCSSNCLLTLLQQTLHIVRQAAVNLELSQYSALHDFFSATLIEAVLVTSCCQAIN